MPGTKSNNRYMMIGRGKVVHRVRTKAVDLKPEAKDGSGCMAVRKMWASGKAPKPSAKGLSPDAALALDACKACRTHDHAKADAEAALTPAQRKARSNEARDEVLERAKPKTKAAAAKKASKSKSPKPKKEKAAKPSKEAKPKKASLTKAGVRSTASRADGDPTQVKAQLLADHAKESGWTATIGKDEETGHVVVTATRGDEVINAWFIDGKYDINRHAEIVVGSWTGKLRGAHAARRQMSAEGRDRPHPEPGKGRSGPRAKVDEPEVPEDESPEDAAKRVPFSHDDDAIAIIDMIAGKKIRWRNGVANRVEEATIPSKSKRTKIVDHPKKPGRRILSFLEMVGHDDQGREVVGPERSVALSAIVRVID